MFGGDLPSNDAFTLSLITNEEVLAVNQRSARNRECSPVKIQILIADVTWSPGTSIWRYLILTIALRRKSR